MFVLIAVVFRAVSFRFPVRFDLTKRLSVSSFLLPSAKDPLDIVELRIISDFSFEF